MTKIKDTIITLYVNTSEIINYDKKDQKEVDRLIILADNHRDLDPKSKEDFTSKAPKKSKLAWVGAVMNIEENPQDAVIITKIKLQKSKTPIIELYDSKHGAGKTHVDGFIKKGKLGDVQGYRIHFLVESGDQQKKYKIDPKIRIV
jgi:hypothetical protein